MARCGTCAKEIPEDPNEVDEILSCKYCDAILCSSECLADHEEEAHAGEAIPAGEDEDERR